MESSKPSIDPTKLFAVHITHIFPTFDSTCGRYVMRCGGAIHKTLPDGSKRVEPYFTMRPTLHWAVNKVVDTLRYEGGGLFEYGQKYAIIEPLSKLSDEIWGGDGDDIMTLGDHWLSDSALLIMPEREVTDEMRTGKTSLYVYHHLNPYNDTTPNQLMDFKGIKEMVINFFAEHNIPYNVASGYIYTAKSFLEEECMIIETDEVERILKLDLNKMRDDPIVQQKLEEEKIRISCILKVDGDMLILCKNRFKIYSESSRQIYGHVNLLKNQG